MASNQKVFVSPGVYTSEVDLSFVAQSVGVTTLGIVGETLRGPAFEPTQLISINAITTQEYRVALSFQAFIYGAMQRFNIVIWNVNIV